MASPERFKSSIILMFVLLFIVNVAYAQTRNPVGTITVTSEILTEPNPTPTNPPPTTTSTQDKTQDSSSQEQTQQSTVQNSSSNDPTDSGDQGPTGGGNPQTGRTQKQPITTTINQGGGAITITSTSTSYSQPSSTPTSTKSSSESSSNSDSSTNVVTAAIAVGAVVIAAIIGIWIFRKWKLTPSNNFKEKIQPVSFAPRSVESDTVFLRELNEP